MSHRIAHRNLALLVLQDIDTVRELEVLMPFDEFVLAKLSPVEFVIDPNRITELSQKFESKGLSALVTKQKATGRSA